MFRKQIKNLLGTDRKKFERICKANQLKLDFDLNKDALNTLSAILEEREYADYFPFYKKSVIVDVGAHYGFFSLFARVNSGEGSRVISIEPDSSNFQKLNSNILSSGLRDIEAMNCAVSGESGKQILYKGKNVNHSLIKDFRLTSGLTSEKVRVKTLEEILEEKNISHVDFLKLDCEGAEYSILMNASTELFQKISVISMEFHDMKDVRYSAESILSLLTSNSYRIAKFHYSPTTKGLNYGKIMAIR